MVDINVKVLHMLPGKIIWFSDKPNPWRCINSYYKQSNCNKRVVGYKREAFYTKVIDIRRDIQVVESAFEPNTAYEIRRALKDGVTTTVENDIESFITFYNLFAKTKKLPKLSANFNNYGGNLLITKAVYDGQDVVMHAYLKDEALKRVRLMHSASLFRNEKDSKYRALVGRANRLLHYKDICSFKEIGYECYDLGGYAHNTTDDALIKINKFKDSFGGELKQETDYLPLSAQLLTLISKTSKK